MKLYYTLTLIHLQQDNKSLSNILERLNRIEKHEGELFTIEKAIQGYYNNQKQLLKEIENSQEKIKSIEEEIQKVDKKRGHLKIEQQEEKEMLGKSKKSKKILIEECNNTIELLAEQKKDLEEKVHEATKEKAELKNKITKEKDFLIENKFEIYIKELPNDEEKIKDIIHNLQLITNELQKNDVKKEIIYALKGNIRKNIVESPL